MEKNGRQVQKVREEWLYFTEDGITKRAKYRIYSVDSGIIINEKIYGTEEKV